MPRTDDDVCRDYIRLCVRLYISVHKFYIRTVVDLCSDFIYVFAVSAMLYTEIGASSQNFYDR